MIRLNALRGTQLRLDFQQRKKRILHQRRQFCERLGRQGLHDIVGVHRALPMPFRRKPVALKRSSWPLSPYIVKRWCSMVEVLE